MSRRRTRLALAASLSLTTHASAIPPVYDYAIVGGGTTGLLLATLLSANPNTTVAVLEAGADARTDPRITLPENEGAIVHTPYDWNFTTTPQPGLYNNATIPVSRGKTLGGSSAMNWMIWQRGSAAEYDAWEGVLGLSGWNWTTISAASRRSEAFVPAAPALAGIETSDPALHGSAGPVHASMARGVYSLYPDYVVPALRSLGVPILGDAGGGNITGAAYVPLSVDNATYTRSYAGSAYTAVQGRPNLHVFTHAHAARLIWSSAGIINATTTPNDTLTATAIEYYNTTTTPTPLLPLRLHARRFVLSTGSISTPPLLERSGIGSPARLSSLSVPLHHANSAVGTRFRDHLTYAGAFTFNATAPFTSAANAQDFLDLAPPSRFLSPADRAAATWALAQAAPANGTSPATLAVVRALWAADEPAIEFAWYQGFVNAYLLHPLGEGEVHASSASPFAEPEINPGFNAAGGVVVDGVPWDLWVLAKAVRYYATTVAGAEPLAGIGARFSLDAGVGFGEFAERVREGLGAGDHYTGGAVLGSGGGGVVDGGLLVRGTRNVWVADLSVVPVQVGHHTMGLAYAVAERAAGLLVGGKG